MWANLKKEIESIHAAFPGSVTAYGDTETSVQESVDAFISGKSKMLIAHPKSIGHGVTLVNCNRAVYYSIDYDPELYAQSLKRIHRIGQSKTVYYHYLICAGPNREKTLDESIEDVDEP